VPVVEGVRLDDASRARIRAEGPAAIRPAPTLKAAAQELVQADVTDQNECERVLGE